KQSAALPASEARCDRGPWRRGTSLSGVPREALRRSLPLATSKSSASHEVAFRVSEWRWAEWGGAAGHAGSRRRISAPGAA
ncbi:unnamed protein product, partial [Ixodes hexagonus]